MSNNQLEFSFIQSDIGSSERKDIDKDCKIVNFQSYLITKEKEKEKIEEKKLMAQVFELAKFLPNI